MRVLSNASVLTIPHHRVANQKTVGTEEGSRMIQVLLLVRSHQIDQLMTRPCLYLYIGTLKWKKSLINYKYQN